MDRKLFLVVIKELNQDEKLLARIGEKKITVIGKGSKNEDLIENFKRVMIKLDDAGLTDDVPENCIDFFEENLDEFMPKKAGEKLEEEVEGVVENPEEGIEEESVEEVKENKDEKVSEEKSEEVSTEVEATNEKREEVVEKKKKTIQKLSVYGHKIGTQAAKIDELFETGTTMENAAKVVSVKQSRIKSHLYHLQKKKNLVIEVDDNGIYKVKG